MAVKAFLEDSIYFKGVFPRGSLHNLFLSIKVKIYAFSKTYPQKLLKSSLFK